MTVAEDDIKAYGRVVARAFLTKVTVRQVVESAEAAANRRASTTIYADRPGGILGEIIVQRLGHFVDPSLNPSNGMDVFGTGSVMEDNCRIGESWEDRVKEAARQIVMKEWNLPEDYCPHQMAVREMAGLVRALRSLKGRSKAAELFEVVQGALLVEEDSQRSLAAGEPSSNFLFEDRIGEIIQKAGFPEIPGYDKSV